MASPASSSPNDLSTAQAETYAMLLNMGFAGSNAITAAKIFGSDISAAVNYLTSEPPPSSAFYQPQPSYVSTQHHQHNHNTHSSNQKPSSLSSSQSNANHNEDIAQRKRRHLSPDDIATEEFLDRIAKQMRLTLDEDEILDSSARFVSDMQSNDASQTNSKQQSKSSAEYKAKSKEEIEFDEKTNENIKNITKRLSFSRNELISKGMIGKAVWFGDILSLREYPAALMDELDDHGNTALSLACRLGHDSVSHALLEMGADPTIELGSGWNVIQEAVLHRDARLVRDLLIHQIQLRGTKYESRNKEIIAHLKTMPDFSMEISWQITSTLAVLNNLISKFAKIDNFKIWKKGTSIRFDMFMRGFSAQGVEKGHVSFVFSESGTLSIDHDRKTFTNAIRKYKNPDYDEMEREIRILLRTEQGRASLRTSNVAFERKKGWMGGDKSENIEGFQCEVMTTKGLSHSIVEDKRKGGGGGGGGDGDNDDDNDGNVGKGGKWQHPTFEEYFEGTFDEDEEDGSGNKDKEKKKRKFSLKKKKKEKDKMRFTKRCFPSYIHRKDQPVDVTLWLCQNYPLTDENISVLLEAISIASEDMRRLADIFKLKFPGGFPVKLTMPIVVGISASATFCNFKRVSPPDDLFQVPSSYRMV
eukprot:CAMPEP_0197036588 /NCGR_PEP_ID=MMETSP1384-20130603/14048_1 /TAXON_ID=29189 /ORGANISM="Ammonia sp." /LENGTH=642 /DNA_ID=CAMNT_0042466781 /DNA_START=9 /DNA_END=1937 /DNA_ORIENTATION=+